MKLKILGKSKCQNYSLFSRGCGGTHNCLRQSARHSAFGTPRHGMAGSGSGISREMNALSYCIFTLIAFGFPALSPSARPPLAIIALGLIPSFFLLLLLLLLRLILAHVTPIPDFVSLSLYIADCTGPDRTAIDLKMGPKLRDSRLLVKYTCGITRPRAYL